MHISLDGFVAGPQGEMNWININQEIFDHVEKRIAATDAALYGRKTYDMMEAYWPTAGQKPDASAHDVNHSKWYAQAHKIVLSKSMKGMTPENTTIISENIEDHLLNLKSRDGSEILLFGSPTATHALLEKDLIDGFWLFVNPIVLSMGIPLFSNMKQNMKLKLMHSKTFQCGVTELSYLAER
jgi:dihydrofolate reductase